MSIPNDQMEELRKKAFYDSHISLQNNIKKHKNTTDPILQEKDNYVSSNIYIIKTQKIKEVKTHIESQNYFNKLNLEKAKIQRPKKTFIDPKDCLDKDFKDKSQLVPQVPQKKPGLNEYEKRNHQEKIKRKPKTCIPQEDNVFNFQPLERIRNKKKMVQNEVPSKYYKKENIKMSNAQYIEEKPPKKYNDIARKDNINDIFERNWTQGNTNIERQHKKVNYKGTEVQKIFEDGKNNIPVGYKELTLNPEKNNFDDFSSYAMNNFDNIRKNGRKPLKRDF